MGSLLDHIRQQLLTREGLDYYTSWSTWLLIISLALATVGWKDLVAPASANALCMAVAGAIFFTFYDTRLDIDKNFRHREFTAHFVPLALSWLSVALVLPRTRQSHSLISLAFLFAFVASYLSTPSTKTGSIGLRKINELYGEKHARKAIFVIPLTWIVLLTFMKTYKIQLKIEKTR